MKSFDLEQALFGKPVVTRSGDPVTQIVKFDLKNNIPYSIAGIHNGHICTWSSEGIFNISTDTQHQMDLFMALQSKFLWINLWQQLHENGNYQTTVHTREDRADMEIENNFRQLKHIKKIKISL
jgi:hypothetical protein